MVQFSCILSLSFLFSELKSKNGMGSINCIAYIHLLEPKELSQWALDFKTSRGNKNLTATRFLMHDRVGPLTCLMFEHHLLIQLMSSDACNVLFSVM
uniref:Secreted protein n=1 Tax=Arundo donax TaxID=35708 RepID=A0A0A9DUB4_ARUDO